MTARFSRILLLAVSLLALALSGLMLGCERKVGGETGPVTVQSQPQASTLPKTATDTTKMYKKPTDAELRQRLSPLEYEVTQREATEPPFNNRYWDNHEEGLYVDIATS